MEQDVLKIILNKLDKIEAGQQKLEADITDIKKDTARIPYVEQAVSEVNREGHRNRRESSTATGNS